MANDKGGTPGVHPLRDLAGRVIRGIRKDHCGAYVAQMAYFFLFALFPFFLFLTTLLAYLPVPDLHRILLGILSSFVPAEVLSLVRENLHVLISQRQGGLLSIGVLLDLWAGSKAVTAVMAALNDAFETEEGRPFWKLYAIAVLLVIGFSLFIIVSMLLLMFGPRIGDWIASLVGLGGVFTLAWKLLRWPVILGLMVTALSALYRFAPAIRLPWRNVLPGAAAATGAWVAVSLAFSYYVNNFGAYNRTYGSIGAVIALLAWMYASGYAILLGGEINARLLEMEKERPEPDIPGGRRKRKSKTTRPKL